MGSLLASEISLVYELHGGVTCRHTLVVALCIEH